MPIPLRLLIVEDSPVDAELLQHVLRHAGYEVAGEVVDDAEAMRNALQGREWDAITSDHRMPGFSAPKALALAKALRPATPFIVVSGETDLNLAVSLIKEGAQDYVKKAELHRLAPAIEHALKEAAERRERERARQALETSEALCRHTFEAAPDGILILDADTEKVLEINPFLLEMSGLGRGEFVGRNVWEIGAFAGNQGARSTVSEQLRSKHVCYGNLQFGTRLGRQREVEFVGNAYVSGGSRLIQLHLRDITDLRPSDMLLQQVPNFDGLTGLPNRLLFYDRLGQAIRHAEREHHEVSLLCVDVDHFEQMHAAAGAGEAILKGAADRILKHVRQSDTVARIGNEQFAVILPRVASPQNAAIVAKKLIDALVPALAVSDGEEAGIKWAPSIGIAIFPTFAADPEALVRAADSAMSKAKQRGQGFGFGTA